MTDDYTKNQEFFAQFLLSVTSDINYLFTDRDEFIVPSRIAAIAVFSAIDTVSTYSYIYKKNTYYNFQRQGDKFKNFVDEYILTKENKTYRENSKYYSITSNDFYKLRNSLTHFFGLPKGLKFTLADQDILEQIDKKKIKLIEQKTLIILIEDLKDMFLDAVQLFLEKVMKDLVFAAGNIYKRAELDSRINIIVNTISQHGAVSLNSDFQLIDFQKKIKS